MSSERERFIDAWAERVKNGSDWRREHNAFIDAQVLQANAFYRRFLAEKGSERFKKLTGASDGFIRDMLRNTTAKSRLTEKDAVALGRVVKASLHKRHEEQRI